MNLPIATRTSQATLVAAMATAILCLPVATLAQTPPAAQRAIPSPTRQRPAQAAIPQTPATQGLASGKASGTDDVVARVGNANISAEEIRSYVGALSAKDQAALTKDPALLSQAVRMLLANRLVLQEAVAKKWDQQPNVVTQLDRVRENALVEIYLQSVSVPPQGFPSEEEVQKVYEANRSALLMPRQFQLAQIFVAAAKDGDKATEDKAKKTIEDIQAKLKALGADFAEIAHTQSDSKDGSDLGWLVESQIRPEIKAQVLGLTKNGISEALRLDDGWHILKLIDTKAAYTRTLPEVREQLVQQMRSERANMMRRSYLAELLKQHPPVLNELALSNLLENSHK